MKHKAVITVTSDTNKRGAKVGVDFDPPIEMDSNEMPDAYYLALKMMTAAKAEDDPDAE